MFSTLRYELAILIPNQDQDAFTIARLCVLLCLAVAAVCSLILIVALPQIASALGMSAYSKWLYFLPIAIFLSGSFNALYYLLLRREKHKSVAASLIGKSAVTGLFQWVGSISFKGVAGLIFGQVLGIVSGVFILSKSVSIRKLVNFTNTEALTVQAKRFIRFPKFTLPGNMLNTLFLNGVPFLVIYFFSSFILGQYVLAARMLGVPARVFGTSLSQIYFQQLAQNKNGGISNIALFLKTLTKLSLIAVVVFGLLFFIVQVAFGFVFGESWAVAGSYAQILIPFIAVRFVSSALSPTLHVYERQDITFGIQSVQLLSLLLIFGWASYSKYSFEATLALYSLVYAVEYAFFTYVYYRVVKSNT